MQGEWDAVRPLLQCYHDRFEQHALDNANAAAGAVAKPVRLNNEQKKRILRRMGREHADLSAATKLLRSFRAFMRNAENAVAIAAASRRRMESAHKRLCSALKPCASTSLAQQRRVERGPCFGPDVSAVQWSALPGRPRRLAAGRRWH